MISSKPFIDVDIRFLILKRNLFYINQGSHFLYLYQKIMKKALYNKGFRV